MPTLLKNIYYHLKPLIPRTVQLNIRRKIVSIQRQKYKDIWPIDERAASPPKGWQGWPDGKKFALVLTHDVETENGLDNCHKLIELEKSLGFRSSFNFVAEDYNVPSELRQYLTNEGFEVGIHGLSHDGKLYSSRETFEKQAKRINQYLMEWKSVGFRSPSMHHNLKWLHDLNIEYDASTFDTDPFEPLPHGMQTIFPFWVNGNGSKGYVELPYTLPQDFTLFSLLKEKNISTWKRKLDWVAERGGMVLLITHPDYMSFHKERTGSEEYPAIYYEEFLRYIKTKYKNQYWHVLPKDISIYWAKNKYYQENTSTIPKKVKKIWIDLDNSPHVPFFKPIIKKLKEDGYPVFLTARDCAQTCQLADLSGLQYKRIGRHHGKNKIVKVLGLFYRAFQLLPSVVKEKPDLALSHGSRAQTIASKILGINSIVISDYEYAKMLPFYYPDWMLIPEVINNSNNKIGKNQILKYPGIKEDVYIPSFNPNSDVKKQLGLNGSDLVVTIRPPATDAHYFVPESEELFEAVMGYLTNEQSTKLVVLPRNEKQLEFIRKKYQKEIADSKVVIPKDVIDGLSLLWFSDLVISGGGTMNREAASLGVPVYSIFRGKIGAVDRYLSQTGRLILIESVEDIKTKINLKRRHIPQHVNNVNKDTLNSIVGQIKNIADRVTYASKR